MKTIYKVAECCEDGSEDPAGASEGYKTKRDAFFIAQRLANLSNKTHAVNIVTLDDNGDAFELDTVDYVTPDN